SDGSRDQESGRTACDERGVRLLKRKGWHCEECRTRASRETPTALTAAEALAAELGDPILGHDQRAAAWARHRQILLLHHQPTRPTPLQENRRTSPSPSTPLGRPPDARPAARTESDIAGKSD